MPDITQTYKEQGLCVWCSKKALPMRTYCPEHLLEHRKSNQKYYQNNIEIERQKKLATAYKRIKEGRCRSCGNTLDEDADEGHRECMNCRESRVRRCR